MTYWFHKLTATFGLMISAFFVFSQSAVSVDVNQVIRTMPQHAIGINVNYLMDGSYISPNTSSVTTQTIKNMGMKMLRYPGGEKSDNYLWSSSPYDRSKPTTLLTGECQFPSGDTRFIQSDFKTLKPEVLDFDEFMAMCLQSGAEPFIVCAYDAAYYGGSEAAVNICGEKPTKQQLINNAKEWVRYANKTKNYGVKYWSIGNESWNDCLYNGCVSAAQYALDIIEFANAMRSVDPTIKIIANGRGIDWWKTLLQNATTSQAIDYFSVSCYPVYNYTGGYSYYRSNNPDLKGEVQVAVDAINTFAAAADKARIRVITTEFNSIDFSTTWPNKNDVGHALVAADILGQCLELNQVEAMLFWNTRWIDNLTIPNNIYDALNKESNMNANGLILSVWGNNILSSMVGATKTGPVRSFAFYDAATKKVNILLINKEISSHPVNLSVLGLGASASYSRWEYRGVDTGDVSPSYLFKDSGTVAAYPYAITLAANSLTVLKLGASGITLPLPTLTFTAVLQTSGNVQLNWQNNMADDNFKYAVERSDDGVTWSTVTTIPADITTINRYAYEDINPLANKDIVYYRIAQTTAQGQVSYSVTRTVQKQRELSIRVLNNPTTGMVNFSLTGIRYSPLKINLYDDKGSIIKRFPERSSDGNFSLEMAGLPHGLYFFQFISPITQRIVKVIKQ